MYKYGEAVERRIKADREALKSYGDAVQILRAAARADYPPEVVNEAGGVVKACGRYMLSLPPFERAIFERHYCGGVSLQVLADELRCSKSRINDIIRRTLAARALGGGDELTETRARRRTARVKREQPKRSRRFTRIKK